MHHHHHNYLASHRKQTLWLTMIAGVLTAGMVIGLIVYCYHSSHLRF